MQCAMCGREVANPNANYCDYCGTALGTMVYREETESKQQTEVKKEDRVPTWYFLGVMCLPFLPMVGTIAYLVILFYWAFAVRIEDSRKSFARATLIYTGVMMVITYFFADRILGGILGSMASLL